MKDDNIEIAITEQMANTRKGQHFKKELNAVVHKEIEDNSFIVCSRVEDFDPAKDRAFWKDKGLNSKARHGVECFHCHHPVVLSDHMYAMYLQAMKEGKKVQPLCNACIGFPPKYDKVN